MIVMPARNGGPFRFMPRDDSDRRAQIDRVVMILHQMSRREKDLGRERKQQHQCENSSSHAGEHRTGDNRLPQGISRRDARHWKTFFVPTRRRSQRCEHALCTVHLNHGRHDEFNDGIDVDLDRRRSPSHRLSRLRDREAREEVKERQRRGAYMIRKTPPRQISAPMTSNRSGLTRSIAHPHRSDSTMKMPPYAA